MLDNSAKYDYVKDVLLKRMSRYRRNSFKLQRLYNIIQEQVNDEAYISFSYNEFREMFIEEYVNGNIPLRKFEIVEEGFLDRLDRLPYAIVHVTVFPKKK